MIRRRLAEIYGRDGDLCYYCGRYTGKRAETIDHIVPRSLRPDLQWELDNMIGACKTCNYRRGVKPWGEFAEMIKEECEGLKMRDINAEIRECVITAEHNTHQPMIINSGPVEEITENVYAHVGMRVEGW